MPTCSRAVPATPSAWPQLWSLPPISVSLSHVINAVSISPASADDQVQPSAIGSIATGTVPRPSDLHALRTEIRGPCRSVRLPHLSGSGNPCTRKSEKRLEKGPSLAGVKSCRVRCAQRNVCDAMIMDRQQERHRLPRVRWNPPYGPPHTEQIVAHECLDDVTQNYKQQMARRYCR
ncbi:hypothetical protein IQ06DRAFT_83046 [Phaeosphaeriaceae sp. SRC1lsM3a]|nr:hypothetical protein IQ06DRAFT_83046 [Stagonospora sp. SRC1lsM3a]